MSLSQAQVISCLENECENKVASTAILLHQGHTAFVCIDGKQKISPATQIGRTNFSQLRGSAMTDVIQQSNRQFRSRVFENPS